MNTLHAKEIDRNGLQACRIQFLRYLKWFDRAGLWARRTQFLRYFKWFDILLMLKEAPPVPHNGTLQDEQVNVFLDFINLPSQRI
jgi:hypothetical protein